MLRYKGYTTMLQLDPDSHIWHGRVLDIRDVVTFAGKTQMEAEKEFRRAVEAYLNFCQTVERLPNQPLPHKADSASSPAESLRGQDDNFDFSMR
jgi:predicted HicB family RNase H-like nuclease